MEDNNEGTESQRKTIYKEGKVQTREDLDSGEGGPDVRVSGEEGLIIFTDSARDAYFKTLKNEGKPEGTFLRLGVVGGGCAGFNYDMFFSEGTTDRDRELVCNGVNLVVDDASLMYLVGTTVDFATSFKGSGFTFNNPNAKSTCGCAMSFTV